MSDKNPIVIESPDDARFAFANMALARILGNALARTYPGRRWAVQVDSQNGILDVICPDVSVTHGYCLHLRLKTIQELELECIRAGGEILERFSLSRERDFNRDTVLILPRDFRGNALGGT